MRETYKLEIDRIFSALAFHSAPLVFFRIFPTSPSNCFLSIEFFPCIPFIQNIKPYVLHSLGKLEEKIDGQISFFCTISEKQISPDELLGTDILLRKGYKQNVKYKRHCFRNQHCKGLKLVRKQCYKEFGENYYFRMVIFSEARSFHSWKHFRAIFTSLISKPRTSNFQSFGYFTFLKGSHTIKVK